MTTRATPTPFAKGAAKVSSFVAFSANLPEEKLDDITVNRGMYERLKERVDQQDLQLATMQKQLESAQDEIEELREELRGTKRYGDDFLAGVRTGLEDLGADAIVRSYTRDFFEDLPEQTRADVCELLLGHFDQKKASPPDLWYSIISNGGAL